MFIYNRHGNRGTIWGEADVYETANYIDLNLASLYGVRDQ